MISSNLLFQSYSAEKTPGNSNWTILEGNVSCVIGMYHTNFSRPLARMPHCIVAGRIPKFEPSGVAGPNPQPPSLGTGLCCSYSISTIETQMIGPNVRMLPLLLCSVGVIKNWKI